jgi:alkanesulfonate monooxygenase SsuD/methylene tetrahydromethanopterin reductase-like flavin-dependent oxidoreductase (luciferase family)
MKAAKVDEMETTPPEAEVLAVERMFKPEEGAGATMLTGSPDGIARQIADLLSERRLVR